LDPRIIGDKPRWYSHYVQPFYYQVHNPHSRLGFDLYEDSETDEEDEREEYPTPIKEGRELSDGCDESCSCCSSYDDSEDSFCSHTNTKDESKSREDEINDKIHSLYDRSYSTVLTEEETTELQEALMSDSVYKAPAYRAEIDIESRRSSDFDPSLLEDASSRNIDRDFDSLSEITEDTSSSEGTAPATSKYEEKQPAAKRLSNLLGTIHPKLRSRLSTDSVSSNVSISSMISNHTDKVPRPSPLLANKWSSAGALEVRSNYSSSSSGSHSPMKSSLSQDNAIYNSENQQLITEVVGYVKSGDGVGWLSTKRLRRVVMYEGLRQYLINQLDIVHKSNHDTLHDVHISRNVYRGYLELLKLLVEGYEHSVKLKGMGGMSSLALFLELAHRYYCGKKYDDDSTKDIGGSATVRRTASFVENIKESTVRLDSNNDKDSDSSLHYHRGSELGHVKALGESGNRKSNDDDEIHEPPSLSHTNLSRGNSFETNGVKVQANDEKSNPDEAAIYLVNKSNCSGAHRFYEGKLHKSVLEAAGRGVTGTGRRYLFEGLQRHRSQIWDSMEFWDCIFLDCVSAEREAAGMDVNPVELLNRYKSVGPREKQLLEEDEDRLLGILLHNMVAFMLQLNIHKKLIKTKIRRLLARSHIGLSQSQSVDNILDNIDDLNGNDIDLMVPRSRQLKIQIFVVHLGDTQIGAVFFLEVREDCIVLKSTNGSIIERWWYENIVNLSCSPKTKVLCIWIRSGEETDLQKISTKKCKFLYNSIKESMKKAAERLDKNGAGMNLGGSFTVVDSFSGQQGILKVSLDGVTILFVDKKLAIDVRHLKNCCAKRKILIVEEYLPHDQNVIEHQFHTEEANEICYAILCLFSYIAAAKNLSATPHSTTSGSDQGTIS